MGRSTGHSDEHAGQVDLEALRYPSDDSVDPADPKTKVKYEKGEGLNVDEQCPFPVEIKRCEHVFGWDCLHDWTEMREGNTCTNCRAGLFEPELPNETGFAVLWLLYTDNERSPAAIYNIAGSNI